MEKQIRSEGPGKAPPNAIFEPEIGVQSLENPLHTMSLEAMVTTVHPSPSLPPILVADMPAPEWSPEELNPTALQDLIHQIAKDMAHSANDRGALKAQSRAAKKERRTRRGHVVDVDLWRAQLKKLLDDGYRDVNVGYWRVSTAKQTEAEGPESQIKDIVSYGAANTDRGIDLWCYDIDSGKEESRQALDFLVEAMQSGVVRSVTVQRLDRFARNNYLAECLNREAFRNRVQLKSATEHIPDGPVGTLFRQVLQALAQYEAALITTRLAAGKKVKKEIDGTWGGGEVPFGYWSVGDGRLMICEPEARIIRLVFLLYERGYNQSAIANALNRWGIPTRKGGRLGWRQGQIRRILRNEGKYRSEKIFSETVKESKSVAHPPILPTRPVGQRSYVFGKVNTRLRADVPDDFVLGEFSFHRAPNTYHKLTPEQGVVLKKMFSLRDSGLTITAVVAEMNRLGLKSLTGRAWKFSNAQAYLSRRNLYEPAIEAAGVIELEPQLRDGVDEAAAVERIHELRKRGMSFPLIRERLQREGFKTANGADWAISSIHRVASGKPRQSAKKK
jgi:DNA invertase Pin-like site-specific DNA recombinase